MRTKVPLYQALANTLEDRIQSGYWPVGSLLPSESSFCKSFHSSRHTLRHALQILELRGLILRRQGAQTQVISRNKPRKFSQSFNSPADILRYPRDTYRVNLLEEFLELDTATSKLLGAPEGSAWFHIGGIRKQRGSELMIAWTDIYILPQFAQLSKDPDHSHLMVFEQIEKKFGKKIDRAEVDVYSSSATKNLAERLKINSGDSCLVIIRRYYDSNNQIFEITLTYHPENRYIYSMEFKGSPHQ